MQVLLDAVPADRTVACFPAHESIILHDGDKELGRIPLKDVIDVSLLDDSSVQRRYTLTRSLILGPLVLLFPKKTIRESYRICILWKDSEGECHIHIARLIMADHMFNSLKHMLSPEVRADLARKATGEKERAAVSEKEQYRPPTETSPFLTCGHCTMEFRKIDLPPGGKCPVCGQKLNVDLS